VEWQAEPVKNRIGYKHLKLDEVTSQEPRHFEPYAEAPLNWQKALASRGFCYAFKASDPVPSTLVRRKEAMSF
jgi:hypothetical protein